MGETAGNAGVSQMVRNGARGEAKMFQRILMVLLVSMLAGGLARAQDAAVLEEQYKTCAKHYIPADKCTAEVYQQLKAKDNAPLDPETTAALNATGLLQSSLRNPKSMILRRAYVAKTGYVCLSVSAQNGLGGMDILDAVLLPGKRPRWLQGETSWVGTCHKRFKQGMNPGKDVTQQVLEVLNR